MIIYGHKRKMLRSVKHIEKVCSSCSHSAQIANGVIKYFHIFWIPVMVYNKKTVISCLHCQKSMTLEEICDNDKPDVPRGLFNIKYVWLYNLLLLAMLAFTAVTLVTGLIKILFA